MGITTIESSLARLESAISRIETLSDTAVKAATTRQIAFTKLDSRHHMLRSRVSETIARLDSLIADAAQGDAAHGNGAAL